MDRIFDQRFSRSLRIVLVALLLAGVVALVPELAAAAPVTEAQR